jgi:hypothetical protein
VLLLMNITTTINRKAQYLMLFTQFPNMYSYSISFRNSFDGKELHEYLYLFFSYFFYISFSSLTWLTKYRRRRFKILIIMLYGHVSSRATLKIDTEVWSYKSINLQLVIESKRTSEQHEKKCILVERMCH